jgi:uncharacterized protein (DUF2252 family)
MTAAAPGDLPAQTHTQTIDKRTALGKALRDQCDRASHANWTPAPNRRDPVDILIEQGRSRLQHLLPLRYARMKTSPFAFLRGGAAVMAEDLASTPNSSLVVQAAGDCHCLNFGGFATPERRLVFDLNDFDETAVAPWEWDLKRLAASFAVATLDVLDKDGRLDLAQRVASSYRETMTAIADSPILDAWYRGLVLDSAETAEAIGIGAPALRKAQAFLTHAAVVDVRQRPETGLSAEPRIQDVPPLVYHPPEVDAVSFQAAVQTMLADYATSLTPERRTLLERYKFADAAYKVVGVGSVGTLCGVLMMVSGSGEILNLQFKEATQSVLEARAGMSPYAHHGERVVRGQRLLQAASDILLGFATGPTGRHIYVRQLRDAKIKPMLETMSARHFRRYAATCGETLARAHARTADAVVLSAYLGKGTSFDEAIGRFAMAYAKQTEQDHASLQTALKSGRLPDAAMES